MAIVSKIEPLIATVTVEPGSAVPVIVGVGSSVVSASTVGAAVELSTVISLVVSSDDELPKASVDVTATSCSPSASGTKGLLPDDGVAVPVLTE